MQKNESNDGIKIQYPKIIYGFILLAALCILGGNNKIFSIIVLIGFVPLIPKPEYLLGPLFFSTIWSGYILVAGGQSLSRYLTIFFVVGVLIKMLMENIKLKVDFWFKTSVAAILLGMTLSLWGIFDYTSIPTSYVLTVLLFVSLLHCPIGSKESLINQIWYYTILSLVYAYWFILRNGFDAFEEGKMSSIEEGVNSNSIGRGICILGIIVLAHFVMRNFNGKVLHTVMILLSLFLIFLTGSRTSLIALIVAGIVTILFYMKLSAKRIWKATILLGIAIVGCYFIYNYLLELLPNLMERFTIEDTLEDGGSGRVDVWKAYLEVYLPDYWFVGVGFDPLNFYYGIEKVNGIGHGAHNHLIDMLGSTGIVGLVLYSWMQIKAIVLGVKYAKRDFSILLPWSMLLASLLTGIGENVLRSRIMWMSMALVIVFKHITEREQSLELEGVEV